MGMKTSIFCFFYFFICSNKNLKYNKKREEKSMSKNMKIKYKKNTTKNNTPANYTFNPLSKMLANFIEIIAV